LIAQATRVLERSNQTISLFGAEEDAGFDDDGSYETGVHSYASKRSQTLHHYTRGFFERDRERARPEDFSWIKQQQQRGGRPRIQPARQSIRGRSRSNNNMSYVESYVSDDEDDYVEAQGYDRRTPRGPPPPAMSRNMGGKSAVESMYATSDGPAIINELRNVGVNVLSIESNSDIISYLDAVATETLAGEQCLVYTDERGRTFNVVVSVRWCRV